MKLTEAERRTWRAAMNQYAETGRITVRGTAERYGGQHGSIGNACERIHRLTAAGLFRFGPPMSQVLALPVPGMAVGSDGTVYREVEMAE